MAVQSEHLVVEQLRCERIGAEEEGAKIGGDQERLAEIDRTVEARRTLVGLDLDVRGADMRRRVACPGGGPDMARVRSSDSTDRSSNSQPGPSPATRNDRTSVIFMDSSLRWDGTRRHVLGLDRRMITFPHRPRLRSGEEATPRRRRWNIERSVAPASG